ncbi:hypothetical protein GCM10009712_41500 [Pseudarthrobacter sulfonivorans]|uniref:trypsin-like peptidase domain-containing protein n=1 Tax=Pseudarthrobacter sulfonivorans TaxID=121292 RepID=UPI0031E0CF70
MAAGTGQTGVELDRVVAVMATWADGHAEVGSGYLVTGRLVLTAGHCIRDKKSGKPAAEIKVVQASDGATVPGGNVIVCPELDVAVITLEDDAPWEAELSAVVFARVDRSRAGILEDCQAIGFPLFQSDSVGRATSEVHGTLYQTDGAESGQLLIRDPNIRPGPPFAQNTRKIPSPQAPHPSPWGGFSGATVFHHGLAIGVIIEHHPAQGGSALRATAFDTLMAADDPEARRIADALGLPRPNDLVLAAAEPVEPLAGLVERLIGGDLPLVQDLNPYLAGATESRYGTREDAGTDDPYVARTFQDVDARLRELLVPGRMVLLVGPSKAGKTRTAFEAIRTTWPRARLLIPATTSLAALAKHPRIRSSTDAIVLWLNDLQRYLTGIREPLTTALLTALLARLGNTVVVATLRTEEWSRLLDRDDELTREARRVLEEATELELGPTSDNPAEQAAAQQAYPGQDLSTYGLAEQLAGAPYLLKQYRVARRADPLLHAVIQTAIDWTRVGMPDPIPETDLADFSLDALFAYRPDMAPTPKQIRKSIMTARTPPKEAGRVAALATGPLPDRTRAYRAFSYLVAADDGQTGGIRPIPDFFWDKALRIADIDAAFSVGIAAYERGDMAAAVRAFHQAATAGNTGAMLNLGILLEDQLDPPDLGQARRWYEQAATAGHTGAMLNLGNLLADQLDPPELEEARRWYEQAATAGNTGAMVNLGVLLAEQTDLPELGEARRWYEQAATAGNTGAMVNLGNLLAYRLDPPDLGQARRWYEQAATAGDTAAMNSLGVLLAEQTDLPELGEARRWYEQAATAGNTGAMVNLGILLADRLNPPDLGQARRWYEQAATAGNTDGMLNLGTLLADRLNPPDLRQARRWYEQAAAAGNTDGMLNLGNLLADRLNPPDLWQARRWFEQAATAGDTDAMNNLGELLAARMDPPELDGARIAWQAVINTGAGHGDSEAVGWAALALALLDALAGDAPHATELLNLAEHHGVPSANVYKETMSPDPSIRAAALQNLENSPKDSDGLNFLGIASYRAGEPATAKNYWLRSLKLDDLHAPLLLHITRNP